MVANSKVRYTGFFLLVGIGVGLSSYVIYKIFGRFRKSKRRDDSENRTDKYVSRKSLDLETPDSGLIELSSGHTSQGMSPDSPAGEGVRLRRRGLHQQGTNGTQDNSNNAGQLVPRPTSIQVVISENETLNFSSTVCRDSVISTNSVDTVASLDTFSSDLGFSSECQTKNGRQKVNSNESSRDGDALTRLRNGRLRPRSALCRTRHDNYDTSSRESTPAADDFALNNEHFASNGSSWQSRVRPYSSLPHNVRVAIDDSNFDFATSPTPSVHSDVLMSLETGDDVLESLGLENGALFLDSEDRDNSMNFVQHELQEIRREIGEMSETLCTLRQGQAASHVSLLQSNCSTTTAMTDSGVMLSGHFSSTDFDSLSPFGQQHQLVVQSRTSTVERTLAPMNKSAAFIVTSADSERTSLVPRLHDGNTLRSSSRFTCGQGNEALSPTATTESPLLSKILGSLQASQTSRLSESSNDSVLATPSSDCYLDDSDWTASSCQLNINDHNTTDSNKSTTNNSNLQKVPPLQQSLSVTSSNSFLSSEKSWEVKNIGRKQAIGAYSEAEWKGKTEKAITIRKGYQHIPAVLGLSHLRQVRGDNYCAIRATLYQALVGGVDVTTQWGPLTSLMQRLTIFQSSKHSYLRGWSFANRLPYNRDSVCDKVFDCVQCLYVQMEVISSLATYELREEYLLSLLNRLPEVDLQLMEAVKVLMMIRAAELFTCCATGDDIPVFVWLMFARDSAATLELFFRNHLNTVGDSSGLEQVDMYLLGHVLGLKIVVLRPSQFGHEDYISHYPDDGADLLPKVYLIAEDDRHYNIVV